DDRQRAARVPAGSGRILHLFLLPKEQVCTAGRMGAARRALYPGNVGSCVGKFPTRRAGRGRVEPAGQGQWGAARGAGGRGAGASGQGAAGTGAPPPGRRRASDRGGSRAPSPGGPRAGGGRGRARTSRRTEPGCMPGAPCYVSAATNPRVQGGSEMARQNTIAGELPVPDFYDPENAARWSYRPDEQAVFERAVRWREQHGIRPAAEDRLRVHLLLIDLQKDFCFPEGTLYVAGRSGRGAIEDNDRIARFIYRNLAVISEITCTLDTHFPHQIFSPAFWVDADGNPPPANRQIIAEQIRSGEVRPNPALAATLAGGDYDWLLKQVIHYCEELERQGKYRLYLWPPHCLLGSEGHALAGVIQEARLFHAYARAAAAPV